MTIHKAKGLEAPVVVLYDCLDKFQPRVDMVPLREEGKIALGFVKDCQPPEWDVLALKEEARLREETHQAPLCCLHPGEGLAGRAHSPGHRTGG
jgi:ATP-dependent exoDNAse (exonuclease V) beta subunit